MLWWLFQLLKAGLSLSGLLHGPRRCEELFPSNFLVALWSPRAFIFATQLLPPVIMDLYKMNFSSCRPWAVPEYSGHNLITRFMNIIIKQRLHNIVSKTALKYASETWALRSRDKQRLEAAQMTFMKIPMWSDQKRQTEKYRFKNTIRRN
jgi:hypothetical protein